MYLDKNKHISFLSFTSYCVNTCDVFILPSRVHFSSSFGSQLSPLLSARLSSHIHPLALGSWGCSHFSSKGLNHSISSPRDSSQILTNRYSPRALPLFFNIGEKVHDSNGCVHSLHMGQKKTQAMICELELRLLT